MELFNNEAESMALAGMLRHPQAYWSLNDVGLTHEDFLGKEARKVMRAIATVVSEKKDPELPNLLEELNGDDNSLTIEYIAKLTSMSCTVAQCTEYVRTVKGLAVSRHLTKAGADIIEIAREHRADSESAMSEAESALRKVRDIMPMPERSPDPSDILRRMREGDGPRNFVPIRFSPTIQDLSGGLQPGHIWVIGGFSSTGKSAVAVNFLVDVLRESKAAMVITPEMTQEQYMIRLLSNISGVPQRSIRDRLPGDLESAAALKRAESALSRANVRIHDDVYKIQDVISQATRMRETVGLDVLLIDFIQLIRGDTGDYSYADMTQVALELQQLAKDLRCTIVEFSQISNDMAKMQNDGSDRDGYYQFKGSGQIKDSSDFSIMLKRDRVRQSPTLDMHVVKNRHGEMTMVSTHMDLPTGRITELEGVDGYDD